MNVTATEQLCDGCREKAEYQLWYCAACLNPSDHDSRLVRIAGLEAALAAKTAECEALLVDQAVQKSLYEGGLRERLQRIDEALSPVGWGDKTLDGTGTGLVNGGDPKDRGWSTSRVSKDWKRT